MTCPQTFDRFFGLAIDGGNVVVGGEDLSIREGLYTNLGGELRVVIDDRTFTPGTDRRFNNFPPGYLGPRFTIDGDQIAFTATGPFVDGRYLEGAYIETNGTIEAAVDFATPHPNPGEEFGEFNGIDLQDGKVVFQSHERGFAGRGVYATLGASPGGVRKVVDQNTLLDGLVNPLSSPGWRRNRRSTARTSLSVSMATGRNRPFSP